MLGHLGPGLIITASIVGSGELIVTPRLGAAAGFSLLWFIILSCVLKVFVQVELARFTISNGVSTLEALNSLPGPRLRVSWVVWLWILMYVGTVFQVGGIVGGIALVLSALGSDWSPRVWAIVVAASCAILLVLGRYRLVESLSTLMVFLFTVCTLIAVAVLQWTPYRIAAADVLSGLTFALPVSFTTAFAAFGITGVGASELIYYPYWCLEKGYARHVGPREETPEWLARARGWLRVMSVDAWVSLVIYTAATVAFYLLGAAVLHAKALAVTDSAVIDTLAHMYRESFGAWGLWVFLTGAFAVLYSTFYVATASNARLFADAASLLGVLRYRSAADREKAITWASVVLPWASALLYVAWERPVTLVLVGAVGQGLMLPFLGFAALHFHYRRTDPRLRPRMLWSLFLWAAAICMALVGIYQVWNGLGLPTP
jgi:manganese transport protein